MVACKIDANSGEVSASSQSSLRRLHILLLGTKSGLALHEGVFSVLPFIPAVISEMSVLATVLFPAVNWQRSAGGVGGAESEVVPPLVQNASHNGPLNRRTTIQETRILT